MSDQPDTIQEFQCPRCSAPALERFWGPCASCRAALVSAYRTDPAEGGSDAIPAAVGSARFEPSMHVVPNHVATKD